MKRAKKIKTQTVDDDDPIIWTIKRLKTGKTIKKCSLSETDLWDLFMGFHNRYLGIVRENAAPDLSPQEITEQEALVMWRAWDLMTKRFPELASFYELRIGRVEGSEQAACA